jgi:hypothetical protein
MIHINYIANDSVIMAQPGKTNFQIFRNTTIGISRSLLAMKAIFLKETFQS